jgi:alkylation response protein AidB-like acyl-CoA dehydrogenase
MTMDFSLGDRSDAFRAEARQFLDEVFAEEFQRAGAPTYGVGTTLIVANIIRHLGTEEQKRSILPRVLGGEIIIVLGFTEPESGSDVAAAQTRAVRDGDEWVIDGQKMFTTNAQEADYVFMLTFYSDVRVDDSLRIGEVNGGWDVMTVGLTFERSGAQGGESIRLLEAMERWATSTVDADGRLRSEDPDVRARLGRAAAENEISTLLARRSAWVHSSGRLPGVEGSMAKLFASEALTRQSADFVDLLGPDGLRSAGDPTAVEGGAADYAFRFALGATTYGGTSEIQRTIIAQRGLGLPRK